MDDLASLPDEVQRRLGIHRYPVGSRRTVLRRVSGRVAFEQEVVVFARPMLVPVEQELVSAQYGWIDVDWKLDEAVPAPVGWTRFWAWWTGRPPIPVARLLASGRHSDDGWRL